MKLNQLGKISQTLLITILISITVIICFGIVFNAKSTGSSESEEAEHEEKEEHAEEGEVQLTSQQLVEQGLKIDTVGMGQINQVTTLPGKLFVNTDQQAHVSPNFSGHVEQVNVALGETVEKGQTLAILSVPELIDQQANLRMAQANLDLARQDYEREQQLWKQGISAKQDYLRAQNAYHQAQISVQSTRARLNALGSNGTNGKFVIQAPISGVISQKDIVIGENVQLADRLFVIEQLKDLWLEFNLPNQFANKLSNNQKIQFKVNGSDQLYDAVIQSFTSQADVQTGRLVVRAKLTTQATELRPNVMVNVLISEAKPKMSLRVQKSALQSIEGKNSIFIIESEQNGQVHLKAQAVETGGISEDGQWIEILSGLKQGEKYISQGSFLLKSELEKGEAGHEH
jgi:membrane fusion protein, heavy metal efflux system